MQTEQKWQIPFEIFNDLNTKRKKKLLKGNTMLNSQNKK